ncbi:MAG: site-specific DNA-methyltransferase, partial [Flavobacteriaceae bacterium]|nr:site-specific DNA-methyltransferase [Flavobacteriaceae bacterium]
SDEIDRLFEPKVLTNWKRYDQDGEHKVSELSKNEDGTLNENLIIKGNNLIALHCLKNIYRGKVKLIYIDPPYNTGGDANIFTYNNRFNHSTWLTFMKNRLTIAKEFLKEDGLIAIAIDHYELSYLTTLADEIFKRENRVGIITIVNNPMGRQHGKFFTPTNDYMIVYAKNNEYAKFNKVILSQEDEKKFNLKDSVGRYKLEPFIRLGGGDSNLRTNKPKAWYPIYANIETNQISFTPKTNFKKIYPITQNGQERTWIYVKDSKKLNLDDLVVSENNGRIEILRKYRIEKGKMITTVWNDKKYNSNHHGKRLVEKYTNKHFSYPKSLFTIIDVLKIMSGKDDLVMDFFSGSGTTGHAVLKLNEEDNGKRKFILVEQLEDHIEVSIDILSKILQANGSFIFCELSSTAKFIVENLRENNDSEVLKLWNNLKNNAHVNYRIDFDKTSDDEFKKLHINDKKKILLNVLDKNMIYIPYSELENKDFEIHSEDKSLTSQFYGDE